MKSITLLSPAKVNLTLEILGRRQDGYHDLRSIMQPVDLFDEVMIEIVEGEGIEFESTGLQVPKGEQNIAWKAAALFLRESGLELGVRIFVEKNTPTGSGLGGGSSNAAAVLTGMNRMTRALSDADLYGLAPELGADVSFFIRPVTSLVEGIGEKVEFLRDFPLLHYVILCPPLRISTETVYEKWDEMGENGGDNLRLRSREEIERVIEMFRSGKDRLPLKNDLERPAVSLYPEIDTFKNILTSLEADSVSMTGSGSAVYAAFREKGKAAEIYDYLRVSPTFQVFLAKGIKGWHRII